MGQEMTAFEFWGAILLGLPFAAFGILLMIKSIKGLFESRKELKAMESKGK